MVQRPARRNQDDDELSRVKTPATTDLNARSLERLNVLHEMHSRLTKAKQQHKGKAVKSDSQQVTSPKGAIVGNFTSKRASNPAAGRHDATSERAYPWESRALGAKQLELKKIVENY